MSSTAASSFPATQRPASRFLAGLSGLIIRRRILISGILFGLLIGQDVAFGPPPPDPFNVTQPLTAAGLTLVVLGLALRSWAVGILRKDRELTTTGPYRLIRNPLYVGSFLMMFGFCTLIADPLNLLFVVGPVLVIYVVKVRNEEQLLARLFPAQWTEFSQSTPRFFPWPKRVSLKADWRASQWMRSREYQAVLASLVALVGIKIWHLM